MKKYKLIKTYPGSPKLNSIFEYWTDGISEQVYDGNIFIPLKTIKAFPNFWKEVVERDYEILSFINIKSKNIVKKHSNGFYSFRSSTLDKFTEEDCLNSSNLDIYSVKRISDKEVFTIKDKINYRYWIYPEVLHNIFFDKNEIKFKTKDGLILPLKDAKLTRKPLFTTKDGFDVFENDNVHWVCDEFTYFYTENIDNTYCNLINNACKGNFKIFSTKQAAENYIIFHKPCLSLTDVSKYKAFYPKTYLKKLEELLRSKLCN